MLAETGADSSPSADLEANYSATAPPKVVRGCFLFACDRPHRPKLLVLASHIVKIYCR